MDVEESIGDDVVDVEDPTQEDIDANLDKSKWFKQDVIVRPETPDPDWFNEPNTNDTPEQSWFNELVNAEKDPNQFDDLMGSTIDFMKFAKNCLKKDKIIKADIELEYNMEQCYLALTDQLDWANPEGD
ncbi:hypothetical protein Tco_0554315 [Tanacetum coccineum]